MRPFERYHKILKNESEAKYLLVKKIPAQEPENLEGALAEHEKAVKMLRASGIQNYEIQPYF